MEVIIFDKAKTNLNDIMNRVCENYSPIIIAREGGLPVVLISLNEYNSMEETLYLTKHTKNAKRIAKAFEKLRNRK